MDEYFEYLLGNPIYMDEDMFIMYHIGWHELVPWVDVVCADNKMQASFYSIFYFYFKIKV
jgi:hypothetical protein